MRIIIHDTYDAVSMWTAHYIASKINAFKGAPASPRGDGTSRTIVSFIF